MRTSKLRQSAASTPGTWEAAAPALLAAFALVTALHALGTLAGLDAGAGALLAPWEAGTIGRLLDVLYPLGTIGVDAFFAFCLVTLLLGLRGWAAALLFTAMAALCGIIEALSRVAGFDVRGRGLGWLLTHPASSTITVGTFPSGHAARVVLLLGVVAMLLPRRVRPLGLAGASICGLLVGLQRVVSGAHTASDVVAGLLLGAGLAASYATLLPLLSRCPSLEASP